MTRYNGSARLFLFISRLFNSNVKLGESKHTRPVYRIFYDLHPINFKMLSFVEAVERLFESKIYFAFADIYITVTHLQIIYCSINSFPPKHLD